MPNPNSETGSPAETQGDGSIESLIDLNFPETEERSLQSQEPSNDDVSEESDAETDDSLQGQDDGESESESESEEEESDESAAEETEEKPDPAHSPKVQKRINELTKKLTEERTRAETVQAQLAELQRKLDAVVALPVQLPVPGPSKDNPFADLKTLDEVAQSEQTCRQTLRKIANGEKIVLDGKPVEGAELTKLQARLQVFLTDYLPEQRAHLSFSQQTESQRQQIVPILRKTYPALTDPETPAFKETQKILAQLPDVARRPDAMILMGDFSVGQAVRQLGLLDSVKALIQAAQTGKPPASAPAKKPDKPVSVNPGAKRKPLPATGAYQAKLGAARTMDDVDRFIEEEF